MDNLICKLKEHIQPFERQLALQELQALAGSPVMPVDNDEERALTFSVSSTSDADTLRDALAYWRSVGDDEEGMTAQIRGEATVGVARNGTLLNELSTTVRALVPSMLPRKRCLRYATHGLHEYRGKFFPQLVRALMNIACLPDEAMVLDPMCGSGTTLVEARLSGRIGYGLDMNPLSVFLTDVKCKTLTLRPIALIEAYSELEKALIEPMHVGREPMHSTQLPENDRAYLARWFHPHMIGELDQIKAAIHQLSTGTLQAFYLACLSNILRKVSQQKNDDLRIRRDDTRMNPGEAIALFLTEASRSTKTVAAFLTERGKKRLGRHRVLEADARQAGLELPRLVGRVDAVITSPPYATALPYIDTDRLSLIYLGLLSRSDHNARDTLMIGNREVTTRGRAAYWTYYEANHSKLPLDTCALIERIDHLNKVGTVGFRRRNLSALLSKYFFDMRKVLQQSFALLRPSGTMFLVIGNNRTTAGGQPIEIRTADHLAAIASSVGFRISDRLSMDMLVSRDIFRKNAISSEQILRLDKSQ